MASAYARPTFDRAVLHLGALWALAFVQPMFGLLGDNAEFFVARGNTSLDILVFAFGYVLVPPLVGAGLVALAERLRPSLGRAALLLLVAVLSAAVVLPPLGDLLAGSSVAIALALVAGVAVATLYARFAGVRTFFTFLSPAPLVFLAFFLVVSPVSDLLSAGKASASVDGPARSSTPIVHIVLDELPTTTLTGPDGRIDAALFPALARFAEDATWYRNATSVAASTVEALPALVTGEPPDGRRLPTSSDHPRSLFTLFRRSHELSVAEPITDICPASLCPEARPPARARLSALADDLAIVGQHLLLPDDLRDGLPAIDRGWIGFRSEGGFAGIAAQGSREKLIGRVVERLRADDAALEFSRVASVLDRDLARPPLLFVHSSLPHGPSRFLPDGRGYVNHRKSNPGFARKRWSRHQWLADQAFQRHVLQVQYTDSLVGELLDRVRAAGLYDDAVIVISADHGIGFRAGHPRRTLTTGAMPDLALVPFLVKLPGQREGAVSDRVVRTVDALPTIAKAAGVELPWASDGVPASERPVATDVPISMMGNGEPGPTLALSTLLAARRSREAHEARVLRHGVYAVGPRPDLIGRRVADAESIATLDAADDFASVALDAAILPVHVSGDIAAGVPIGTPIAVVVNGRVAATTRVFREGGEIQFAALIPPDSLRPGANTVTVVRIASSSFAASR
jgi:sulfatase-like protein